METQTRLSRHNKFISAENGSLSATLDFMKFYKQIIRQITKENEEIENFCKSSRNLSSHTNFHGIRYIKSNIYLFIIII